MNKRPKLKEQIMQELKEKIDAILNQLNAIENGINDNSDTLNQIKLTVDSSHALLKQITEKVTDYHVDEMRIAEAIKGAVGTTDSRITTVLNNITTINGMLKRAFPQLLMRSIRSNDRNDRTVEIAE